MDNFQNRFLAVLSLPLVERIQEISVIIQRCSIKELEEIFPTLIQSIFGDGLGWNLRLVTRERNLPEFDWIFSFLYPMGRMFELCYKLLIEAIKFDVPLASLPLNMRQMLEGGRYSLYYSDLIRVNPLTRQITHISLNAFDYYILHFAIHGHGTSNLHRTYPALANVHAEKLTTLYFSLTAEYITWFLPSNPESVVLPVNIGGTIKVTPPAAMQINSTKPSRAPIYFKLSALNRHLPGLSNPRVVESTPRNNAWRSESVLYLFIDIWLRNNFDQSIDLPSVEFMLLVRVLVKQIHAFGNAADIDHTSMAELRKLAQPMLCANMFNFVKSLISRWPLDGSFQAVLELYLSYIQPWRYTHDRDYSQPGRPSEIVISFRYESFIQENLRDYTQIFVLLMPRCDQLDLSSYRDVLMLYRLIKVFGQPRLIQILRRYEGDFVSSLSPRKEYKTSPVHQPASPAVDNVLGYVTLFNSHAMDQMLERLMRRVKIAQYLAVQEKNKAEEEEKRSSSGFWNSLKFLFAISDTSVDSKTLRDKRRVPEILNFILETSGTMFNIDPNDISVDDLIAQSQCEESKMSQNASSMSLLHNSSNMFLFNGTIPSPAVIRSRVPVYRGDPALLPIQNNEVSFLVRFLYQVCLKINIMFESQLNELWDRQDMVGKLARPLLEPPMTAESFERCPGFVNLRFDQLGPRLYLRPLASYSTLTLIGLSLFLGHLLFRLPSVGVFLLILGYLLKCYISAAFRSASQRTVD